MLSPAVSAISARLSSSSIFACTNSVTLRRRAGPSPPRYTGTERCRTAWLLTSATASGTYEELLSLVVFTLWIFLCLSAVALIRLRRIEPALPRPYSTWGYPWTPILFLASGLAITVNLWLDQPVRSSIGLAIILLGLPFYFHWRKKSDVRVSPNTGV